VNEGINTLDAGGTELTKKMDGLLGLSGIIQSPGTKRRGLPLENYLFVPRFCENR